MPPFSIDVVFTLLSVGHILPPNVGEVRQWENTHDLTMAFAMRYTQYVLSYMTSKWSKRPFPLNTVHWCDYLSMPKSELNRDSQKGS